MRERRVRQQLGRSRAGLGWFLIAPCSVIPRPHPALAAPNAYTHYKADPRKRFCQHPSLVQHSLLVFPANSLVSRLRTTQFTARRRCWPAAAGPSARRSSCALGTPQPVALRAATRPARGPRAWPVVHGEEPSSQLSSVAEGFRVTTEWMHARTDSAGSGPRWPGRSIRFTPLQVSRYQPREGTFPPPLKSTLCKYNCQECNIHTPPPNPSLVCFFAVYSSSPSSPRKRSVSSAATHPVPAEVIAWRYFLSCTSPAAKTPLTLVYDVPGVVTM